VFLPEQMVFPVLGLPGLHMPTAQASNPTNQPQASELFKRPRKGTLLWLLGSILCLGAHFSISLQPFALPASVGLLWFHARASIYIFLVASFVPTPYL
jgi:hypothetical protein